MSRYSALALLRGALTGQKHWDRAWRDPEPKKSYDVIVIGGGPHEWIATTAAGPAARPASPLIRSLARRVAEMFPRAAHLNVIRSWAGIVENTPDGRPILDRVGNVTVATMSGVGFGLSPASGHAIRDLVVDGECSFADIAKLGLARFADLEPDWREQRGWAA